MIKSKEMLTRTIKFKILKKIKTSNCRTKQKSEKQIQNSELHAHFSVKQFVIKYFVSSRSIFTSGF